MKHLFLLLLVVSTFLSACNHELRRTKFIIPRGYVGKMTIYYDKPNGQKEIDKEGWGINRISENGECFSAFPFTAGWTIPNKTWKFYEIYSKDSMTEVPEYDKNEFLKDPSHNVNKKYAFYHSSGLENNVKGTNPNYIMDYYIDSGKNYKKY